MQGLGKGGGGHHGGGGHGGGGHHGGGGRGRGGGGAYFAPPSYYAYPPYLYADTAPLQVVVPDSCEESVRSGCYQRWGHDPARMAQCVRDGYRGCGVHGLGDSPGGVGYLALILGAGTVLGVVGAALLGKSKSAGAGVGVALGSGYAYGAYRGWFPFQT